MEIDIEEIVIKRLSEEHLSKDEEKCFEEWYQNPVNQEYYRDLIKIRSGLIASQAGEKINKGLAWNKVRPVRKIFRMRVLLKYAALVV